MRNDSLLMAKRADAKDRDSASSIHAIQPVHEGPESDLNALRRTVQRAGCNGCVPSDESIAAELVGMPPVQRASALMSLQQTRGNRYVGRLAVQAKLAVWRPDDKYEQVADNVADNVRQIQDLKVEQKVGTQAEVEGKELPPVKPLVEQITPLVQRQVEIEEEDEIQTKQLLSHAPEIIPDVETNISSIKGGGQPLGPETRPSMDQRFGHDFSRVRVHTDSQATNSAAALNARAYTLGNDIIFGAGEYAPGTLSGRSLVAHELAHVIQQEGTPAAVQGKLRISSPSESAEQSADAAARAAMVHDDHPYRSSALQLRDSLRTSSLPNPTIQRAVKTWGGEYDTDKYTLLKTPGVDGVDIKLRFKPNKHVDAELIGMTQTARSLQKGGPVPASTFYSSKAEKTAYEGYRIPKGKDAGTKIDRLVSRRIPLYGTNDPVAGSSLSGGVATGTTQHGYRYNDKAGKLHKKDAFLIDTPALPSGMKESSQTFETTALAVKGVQEGTFYGSVQWGWEKDAAGKVKKLPLSLVSRGVPSATFGRASELWNISKTSEGKETIDLPVVDVKVIDRDGVELFSNPIDAMIEMGPGTPLPRGTRIRLLDTSDPLIHQIEVVDGPMTGQRGYIGSLGSYRDER